MGKTSRPEESLNMPIRISGLAHSPVNSTAALPNRRPGNCTVLCVIACKWSDSDKIGDKAGDFCHSCVGTQGKPIGQKVAASLSIRLT